MQQSDECIICGAPLAYLASPIEMECAICHRRFTNNVRCTEGHYVCDDCHTAGIDSIVGICLHETSTNPVAIMERLMALPTCHMHGPEHHIMVGASLITAYHNAGGDVDMVWALSEMVRRGKQVPGGACGNWGACGAALSTGMFVSIVTRSNPLASKTWSLSNRMTSEALLNVSKHGGPRCCKRDSYLSILAAVAFAREHLGVVMEAPTNIICTRSCFNNQCLKSNCPFFGQAFKI